MVVMHTSIESWVLCSDVVKHYMHCLGRHFSWFTKKSPVVPNLCHRSASNRTFYLFIYLFVCGYAIVVICEWT